MMPTFTLQQTHENLLANEFYKNSVLLKLNNIPNTQGILTNTMCIKTGENIIIYKTALNDKYIRKIKDYIYRLYFPSEIISNQQNFGFTSIHNIYNIRRNQQYQQIRVTPKYIDFKTTPQSELFFSANEIVDNNNFTPIIDQIVFKFGYLELNLILLLDERITVPNNYVPQEKIENQIQTISNQQTDFTKWKHWNTQNKWYLNSHKQYTNTTEQVIYEGIPKLNGDTKIYIQDYYNLKLDEDYTFSIKIRSIESVVDSYFVFRQTILQYETNIIEMHVYKKLQQGKWESLSFTFNNTFQDSIIANNKIELSLEIINLKEKTFQCTEPQFENSSVQNQFINGKIDIDPKGLYYNSQYFQSYSQNNPIRLLITSDRYSLSSNTAIEELTQYYIQYDKELNSLIFAKKNIDTTKSIYISKFNRLLNLAEYQLIKEVSLIGNTDKELYVKFNNLYFYMNISNLQYDITIKDYFKNIYKNEFSITFISYFPSSKSLQSSSYFSKVLPKLGNYVDGKILEYTNNNLMQIENPDNYDGNVLT